jgi:3-oxoacyl-[acyl-carrier-protein] synthase II
MGEGGSMFVLESDASVRRRDAFRYGEFAGFGASSDASHMVIPSSEPGPASRAVKTALADAGVSPDEVDYVNAHAAGTPVGDRAEARVLQLALGEAVARVPVSSTKSMTGHLLSGAAAVEALACLVAIRHQAVPPTVPGLLVSAGPRSPRGRCRRHTNSRIADRVPAAGADAQ